MPGPELPYVVGIVEIVEQPSVRLTTNLVNCPHESITIGMPVQVDVRAPSGSRRRRLHPPVRTGFRVGRRRRSIVIAPAITGAGQSDIGRRLGRDPLELTLDACLAAIADAGLTRDDIDGLSTYPGPMSTPAGFSGAGAYDVIDALRLNVNWYDSGLETSGQLGSVIKACMAVGAGMCDHVLCFRSVWEGSAQGDQGRSAVTHGRRAAAASRRAGSWSGACRSPRRRPSIWIAQFAQAHFHKYGTTKEQLAWIALNASSQRRARTRTRSTATPMTMDDYMASRIITTPFSSVRLRRPVRRCDRGDRVARRSRRRPAAPTVAGRGRWARHCTAGRRGTSSTT